MNHEQPDQPDQEGRQELIEAYLDDELAPEEARAFERRLAEEPELVAEVRLAARIEASLRRSFAAPARPLGLEGAVAERASVEDTVRPGDPRSFWRRAAGLLAVAAGVTALVLLQRTEGPAPGEELAAGETPLVPVGPLVSSDSVHDEVRTPDLEELYDQMALGSGQSEMVCGPSDDLAGTLTKSYGAEIRLRPEAANLLHGPFASSEWPTGTILTGFPENECAVLVAERDAMHRCCLEVELPPGSELKLFTWRVDGLVLTEITPLAEPRLLSLFEAEGEVR